MEASGRVEELLEEKIKSYMRKRVFGLLLTNFLSDLDLKRVTVEIGPDLKLDLSRKEFEDAFKLNALESISHILLNNIMPMIEKKPSFISIRERNICEKEIRGTIDWPSTFKRNLSQGQIFGKEFVVINPRQQWDTPENLLSMLCLLDIIKNTTYLKKVFKESLETSRWSDRLPEARVLDAIAQESVRRTKVPYFKKIEEEAESLLEDESRIQEIEEELERRIRLNLVRNPGYEQVLQWRREYTGRIDTQKEAARILRDIPGQGQEYLSRLYELWVLFEVADVMEDQVLLHRYYSKADGGPLFSGILPNPSRDGEGEDIHIEIWYEDVQSVARDLWSSTFEAASFLDYYIPQPEKARAVKISASSEIEMSPGVTRQAQTTIGLFPVYTPPRRPEGQVAGLVEIPLHPSEDREVFNRKLLFNLTKYIRALPYSADRKAVMLYPLLGDLATGQEA